MHRILIHAGAALGRGSRETVLTLAEHHGLVWHATSGRSPEPGRGYHPDGTELPTRLVQGALILPEAMLPARARRRAA